MNRAFLRRSIAEASVALIGSACALFIFGWTRVWMVSLVDLGRFRKIIETLPEAYTKLLPVPLEQLATHVGRIGMTFEELVVFCVMAFWAVARGSQAISGKIGSGNMEMLLAQPISRTQLLLTQSCVTLAGTALIAISLLAGMWAGILTNQVEEKVPVAESHSLWGFTIPTGMPEEDEETETISRPMREVMSASTLIPATLLYFTLGCCLGGITTLISSWDRYRWRTIGLASTFIFLQLFLEIVSMASPRFDWLASCTFMSVYEPVNVVLATKHQGAGVWTLFEYDAAGVAVGLGVLGRCLVLFTLGALGHLGATIIFCRRDLPAPL